MFSRNRGRRWGRLVAVSLAITMVAAACGGDDSDAGGGDSANSGDNSASAGDDMAEGFNWRQFEGEQITIGFSAHAMSDALIEFIPEFEELTGIDVEYEQAPEQDFRVRLNTQLEAGSGEIDIFMTGPSTNWEYSAAGWIEDLQPYIDDPAMTSDEWDFDDFYSAAVDVNRWTGEEFAGVGSGPLYAIPMNEEGYALHYRADVLADAGISVPQTFDELIAAAEQLDGYEFEGNTLDAFVARGHEFWPILITGYGAVLFGYGATDINPDGTSAANSAEAVAATETWAQLMQYTPNDIGTYGWEQAQSHFAAGNAIFLLDADHMSAFFEDPEKSQVVGKVGYALPPEGPAGRASGIWLWSLGMNANSDAKAAAWYFIQWASSKDIMERTVPFGNINPTRATVATSDTMNDYVADWGDYNEIWTEILDKYASWRWNPSTSFSEAGNRWALAVQEIYLGDRDAQEALEEAAADITEIMERARSRS